MGPKELNLADEGGERRMAEQLIDYWKTHKETRFEDFEGKPGRIVNTRLRPVPTSSTDCGHRRKASDPVGIVSVCFGSLSKAEIRWKSGPKTDREATNVPTQVPGRADRISFRQGKAGVPREGEPLIHMHGIVADTKGRFGRPFIPGENRPFHYGRGHPGD